MWHIQFNIYDFLFAFFQCDPFWHYINIWVTFGNSNRYKVWLILYLALLTGHTESHKRKQSQATTKASHKFKENFNFHRFKWFKVWNEVRLFVLKLYKVKIQWIGVILDFHFKAIFLPVFCIFLSQIFCSQSLNIRVDH